MLHAPTSLFNPDLIVNNDSPESPTAQHELPGAGPGLRNFIEEIGSGVWTSTADHKMKGPMNRYGIYKMLSYMNIRFLILQTNMG